MVEMAVILGTLVRLDTDGDDTRVSEVHMLESSGGGDGDTVEVDTTAGEGEECWELLLSRASFVLMMVVWVAVVPGVGDREPFTITDTDTDVSSGIKLFQNIKS